MIDAKKCVDSIFYISQHIAEIKNINVRGKVEAQLRDFYIKSRVVIDNVFCKKGQKKALRESDPIIESILYEADKKYAHRDADYVPKVYNSLDEQVKVLKDQLIHLKKVCGNSLPDVLTLDFIPHDRELYRLVHKIDSKKEEEIKEAMHPLYNKDIGTPIGKPLKVYHDTEDKIEGTPNDYAVIVEAGLNDYEGLQNRQDFCMKFNKIYGENMWCHYSPLINIKS